MHLDGFYRILLGSIVGQEGRILCISGPRGHRIGKIYVYMCLESKLKLAQLSVEVCPCSEVFVSSSLRLPKFVQVCVCEYVCRCVCVCVGHVFTHTFALVIEVVNKETSWSWIDGKEEEWVTHK